MEFTRALRAADVDVPATGSLEAARVLAEVGVVDRTRTRAALRSALVTDPTEINTFDRLFATFWRALIAEIEDDSGIDSVRADEQPELLDLPEADPTPSPEATEADAEMADAGSMLAVDAESDDSALTDDRETVAGYSKQGESSKITPRGGLPDEAELADPVRHISDALARLTDRGYTSTADPSRIDVRRALRESHQTGGVIVSTPMEGPKRTASRLLFLVDVSKSVLDVIERDFLVRSLSRFQTESRSIRTFFFDTSVQEVTDAIDARSSADAYETLEQLEATWGGGTRIGGALTEIKERYPTAVDRRTAVVIVSDGLETGETSELEAGMNWLSRRGRIVLWWNPLATTPTYEPTCQGMETALPFVDGLFGFAGEDDLHEIASQLERYDGRQPLGYERSTGP
ncbi:VWA domain-containing protein [Natrarchaeobius sp. A-rgal3]|uniref:VWA domain-containing protein n=1 Tax=Natrarchaeobius versutus TaxID=1679078 RepID=UPI00350F5FA2